MHLFNANVVEGDTIVEKSSQEAFSPYAKQVEYIDTTHLDILGDPTIGRTLGKIITDITMERETKLKFNNALEKGVIATVIQTEPQAKDKGPIIYDEDEL